jgi:hypothetical protein
VVRFLRRKIGIENRRPAAAETHSGKRGHIRKRVRERFPVLTEPNIAASFPYASQVRIEDEGALYHVMARGNRRNRIFTFQ